MSAARAVALRRLRSTPRPSEGGEEGYETPTPTTGRTRHEHKITVYLSTEELELLDRAVGHIRYRQGIRTDRGHVVRAAIGIVIQDLEISGSRSWLVERLRRIR
jgi:hypothetical protein